MANVSDDCKLIVGSHVMGYRCHNCGRVERLPTDLKGWSSRVIGGEVDLICPNCSKKSTNSY